MTALGTPVFTHAEDERLAAALLSVVRRPDFDPAILDPWLARFVALEKQVWSKAPPDPQTLDASQNARNLLRSLYVCCRRRRGLRLRGPGGDWVRRRRRKRPGSRCSRPWPRSGGSVVIPRLVAPTGAPRDQSRIADSSSPGQTGAPRNDRARRTDRGSSE